MARLRRQLGYPEVEPRFLKELRPGVKIDSELCSTHGRHAMPTQIVMDYKGDTRHYFDVNDPESLAKAEKRFEELTGQGFTAAVRRGPGEVIKVSSFAPDAEETVFFPRLIGG
jgi:hypothetical protein